MTSPIRTASRLRTAHAECRRSRRAFEQHRLGPRAIDDMKRLGTRSGACQRSGNCPRRDVAWREQAGPRSHHPTMRTTLRWPHSIRRVTAGRAAPRNHSRPRNDRRCARGRRNRETPRICDIAARHYAVSLRAVVIRAETINTELAETGRRVDGQAAAGSASAGSPLLHPWKAKTGPLPRRLRGERSVLPRCSARLHALLHQLQHLVVRPSMPGSISLTPAPTSAHIQHNIEIGLLLVKVSRPSPRCFNSGIKSSM